MKKSMMSMLRNAALALGLMFAVNAEAGFRISQPSADVQMQALMSLQDVGPVGDEDIQSTTGEEPFSVDFTALGIGNPMDAYVLLVNEETGNAVELSADNDVEGKLTIPPLAMAELEMQYLGASPFYRCMVVACAETDLDDDEIVDLTAVETSIGAVELPNFNYRDENGEVVLTTVDERRLVSFTKTHPVFCLADPDAPDSARELTELAERESYFSYSYELPDGKEVTYSIEDRISQDDGEVVSLQTANALFQVTYSSTTPSAAKTAFAYAISLWSGTISGTQPIRVYADFKSLSPDVLGSTGAPAVLFQNGVYRVLAHANQWVDEDISPSSYAIQMKFNSDFKWYYGTDGRPGTGQQDLVSVLLHELCHGLGFADTVDPSTGSYGYGTGEYPSLFDTFLYYNGSRLTALSASQRKAALTSNALYFDGPNAKAANGGNRIKIHSPSTYNEGSSGSHWAWDVPFSSTTFMRYAYAYPFHTFTDIKKGAMKDLGWDLASEEMSAPANFTATQGTVAGKVNLSWSAVSGAASYTVWRALTGSNTFNYLKRGLTSCSCSDDTVSGTTHYRYIVAAEDSNGITGKLSNIVEGWAKERTLSYIEVTGAATLASGSYANYTCTAYYTDGTHGDVSSDCSWSIPYGSSYVDRSGRKVTAHSVSSTTTFTIRAEYGGKNAQKTVTITPQTTTYTITYNLNGGTAGSSMPASASYGTSFHVSAPWKSGSTFIGWTVTSGLNSSTAKWGTTSSPSTSISSSSTKCVNGSSGNVYFINLRNTSGSVTLTANWSSAPIPDNDHLANAAVISGISGHASGSTVGATRESGEKLPRAQGNVCGSIWYSWTAPISGEVTFSTEGSSFDTVLAVYTGGSTHDSLTEFVSDDDGGANRTSIVEFNATAGTTYKISIAGWKTNTGSVSLRWNMDDKVYLFVKRLYNYCLNRDPDESGGANWTARLKSGARDGISAAYGFCLSAEMKRRNLSNAQYVDILYRAMMDRASDANGKAYWVNLLDNGVSRAGVFCGFAKSAEFVRICSSYGIVCGTINPDWLEERDKNYGVTMFVARCYTKALNRDYDVKGLNSWCAKINSSSTKKATAIQVAKSFLNSNEFKKRNLSNSAYVDVLYRTFFDRNPDTNGKKKWLGQLDSGVSRDKVMASFYNSNEFATIMAGYGIR